jgi:hypothetical protein
MITVHKLTLDAYRSPETQWVKMPERSRVLSVQKHGNELVLWAIVDTELKTKKRGFRVSMTGAELVPYMTFGQITFVGTVQMHGPPDPFVVHVFESES